MRINAGFMLLELCIVVALFILISAYTISSFNGTQAIVTRVQTLLLQSTIRHAQWHAISSGKQQQVVFDVDSNTYQYNNQIYQLPKPVVFGAPTLAKGPPAHPTHAITHPVTFVNNQAICFASGAVSSGTVYLTNGATSFALSNAVSFFSYLRVYRYNNGWQRI